MGEANEKLTELTPTEKHLGYIEATNNRARRAKAYWEECKQTAKEGKAAYDEAIEDLTNLIAGGPDTPLLDNAAERRVDHDQQRD